MNNDGIKPLVASSPGKSQGARRLTLRRPPASRVTGKGLNSVTAKPTRYLRGFYCIGMCGHMTAKAHYTTLPRLQLIEPLQWIAAIDPGLSGQIAAKIQEMWQRGRDDLPFVPGLFRPPGHAGSGSPGHDRY